MIDGLTSLPSTSRKSIFPWRSLLFMYALCKDIYGDSSSPSSWHASAVEQGSASDYIYQAMVTLLISFTAMVSKSKHCRQSWAER